jgi:PAS domain S-box-containing protein
MSEGALRVLLVDDEASLRKPLARYLGNMYEYHVDTAANEEEAWERVLRAERPYDVALIDDLLTPKLGTEPKPIGVKLMTRIREHCPETECIIFTGWGMDRALEALQAGAYRYLAKPLNLDELGMAIRMAAEHARLRRERDLLSATLEISKTMLSELNVGKTLEVIAEAVLKLVGAEACAVAFLDHATGKVRYDPIIPLGDATVKWHRHLRGVQLTKQITEMGEPFFLSDVAAEAKRMDENLCRAGVKSFVGVPIPGDPQNLGVLYAYSTRQEAFGTHEQRILQLLAGQTAIALENARLFADTQKSAQRSEALYRTSHALSSYLEEEPVIRAILDAVYRTLGCEHVLISTVDDEAETIGIRHGIWDGKFDVFPEWIEMSQYSLDHPDILTDIYRTGRTEIIKGWDDRFNREIYDKFGHERFLRIFMPIKTRDEVIGVVEVGYDKREKGHISEDEVQLLAAFMYQAAVALENARLFDTTRRASEQLSALNQVVLEIGKELSQNALLQKVIEQAMTLVSAEGGRVYLLDATGEHLTLATTAGLSLDLEGQRIGKNEGLTGEILRTRKPQKVADYYRWRKRLRILDAYKLTCVAGAPILVGDRVLGTLVVHDTRPGKRFDDTMLTLLQQFANHAGLALLKAELLERLQAIQQVSTTITSSLESQEVLNCICQAAVELFGVDHSGLVLFDKSLKWGTVEGEYPAQPNTLGTKIPIEGVLAEERLAFNGETLVFSDVEEAMSELGPVLDIWRRLDIRSILVIPIIYQNRILGSFSLDAVGHVRQFTLEEVELCKVFAAHVAVAVENARLFSELVEAKEWREALIEYAFDAVIAIDQDAKITVFNQRAEEMFSWTAEEMIGNTVARLHTDVGKAREIFNVVNREGAITDWDVELKHRDGTRIPALLSAMLIRDSQGNPIGQAGFIRDLRQVNLLEERLRALMRVSQTITGTLEPDTVLDLIVESAVAAFPAAQSGVIHLYDERAGTLRVRAITRDYSAEALRALNLRVGEGIAGWVFQNQQPLVLDDVGQDPRYKRIDHPEVQAHRSMVCVPLRAKEQVIGTLSLSNSDVAGAFQAEDLGLLSSFADQAAIAIDNARRMQELEQMRQAAKAMSRAFEPRQALQQVVESASQVLRADSAAIWSYDEVRDKFIPDELVAVGISLDELERFRGEEPKPGRTADLVMREGYVAVTDISQPEYDFLGQPTQELLSRIGVRSFQGIALRVGDDRLGVLYANYNRLRTFGEDEGATLRTFASHASLALKNARLLTQMQRTREAAGVIAGVTVQEDLNQTLKIIAQHTQQVLHSDAVTLYSYDEATKQFGEWATKILDPRDPDAARAPDKLTAESVVWSILNLTESPYYCLAEDHASRHELLGGHFVDAEVIRSAIGIQLRVGERKVGVMFVNFRSPHRFTSDEIATIRLFADQAAMAIRNAQLYRAMRTLYGGLLRAGEAAVEAGKFYPTALQVIADAVKETLGCDVVSLYAYYEKENEITYPSVIAGDLLKPGEQADWEAARLSKRLRLDTVSREVVIRQFFESGRSLYASDVSKDPVLRTSDFVRREAIKSSAAILLKAGDKTVGILFVNYRSPHVFAEEEQEMLELFATQAAIAIQNAQQYEELKHTKGLVGARTAMAWIGMTSSAWRHAIEKHALTIREQIQLLRLEVRKTSPSSSSIQEKLDVIERLANQILEKPMTPPLSAEDGVSSVPVNEFVLERTRQLWTAEPYKSVSLRLDLDLDEVATIRVSPEWLRRALDILVDNAVEAISDLPQSQITITSRSIGNRAEIAVTDGGRGIPEEIQARLFREPIPKPKGAKGLGLGLLIAQTIVQTYGGEIRLDRTDSSGTTMVILLPLETGT